MTAVTISEADLQKAVIDLARLTGWTVAHFRPARIRKNGEDVYRTPVSADGKGFPDLVLAHPHYGVVFVELKSADGKVSEHQQGWLDVLEAAGADVRVWRPDDWDEIETTLTGGRS